MKYHSAGPGCFEVTIEIPPPQFEYTSLGEIQVCPPLGENMKSGT